MNDKLSTLTTADIHEFKTHEAQLIEFGLKVRDNAREFLKHLGIIEKRELWRAKYKTRDDFIKNLSEAIGRSGRTIYRMLEAEKIRFQIKNCQVVKKNTKSLAKTLDSLSTAAVLELNKVLPTPDDQAAALEIAATHYRGTPTKDTIVAAAKVRAAKTAKVEGPRDKHNVLIPTPALVFWEQRDFVQPWLTQLSQMRVAIEKARAMGEGIIMHIEQHALDLLSQAHFAISNAKLAHVCTKCQGWWDKVGGCSTCHNTGLVSQHHYAHYSPKEIKEMRERANRL